MASAEIIFGEPTNVDGFEGGGHAKSAGALVDGITRIANKPDRDENGRQNQHLGGAIGLEGAWGSGKSTVIEIAEKSLGPKFHVFTFDLWRHQSDDFRRSLLEEFLDYLKTLSENPSLKIDKVNIAKERKAVRNRQTITTTTSKRRYTFSGVIAILALPLLPLLYAWAQPAAFVAAGKVADPSQPAVLVDANSLPFDPMWSLYILAAYLLLFPIIAAYTYIRMPAAEKEVNSEAPRWRRWFTEGASHFLTLSRKEKTNEDIKTIRDEDPTTVEFREVFERILKPIQVDGRRVVFVLDNVDRLPEQDVQRLWSDMRALISKSGKDKSAAVIAVIPYDRNHVAQAFPPIKVAKVRNVDGVIGASGKNGDSAEAVIVESDVFEKTFDRIVKVSAPVPSNWKAYLTSTIVRAFGRQHDANAIEKLFRILKYKMELEGVHPTPRRIISYVNEIGSLWVQWGDEGMPVATIGLYVLHRPAFDRDPDLLSKPHPVDIRFQRIVDDEQYARHLAALAFNVAPVLADQVRLGRPIVEALLSADGHKRLEDLSASPGFLELFPDELRNRLMEWSVDSPESISTAAVNVDGLELPSEIDGAVWQAFADAVVGTDKLDYSLAELTGLPVMVRRQKRSTPEALATVIRGKIESTEPATEASQAFENGARWYGMMVQLSAAVGKATDQNRRKVFWATAIPSESPDFNIGVIASHSKVSGLSFGDIQFGCSDDDISAVMLEMLKVNPAGYSHCMLVVGSRLSLFSPEHLEAIATKIENTEPDVNSIHLMHAVAEIMQFSSQKTLRDRFASIASDTLLKYVEWAYEEGDVDDKAVSIYVAASANNGTKIEPSRGAVLGDQAEQFNEMVGDFSQYDEEILEYLATYVENSGHASTWIAWAINSKNEASVFRRLAQALTKHSKARLRDLPMIATHFNSIVKIVGNEGAAFFLRQFQGRDDDIRKVFAGDVLKTVPTEMISMLAGMDDGAAARIILSMIEAHLASLTADQWHSALTEPASEDLRLLSAMSEFCRLELRSPEFIRGLVTMCTNVIEGKFDPASIASVWPHVQKAIPPSQYTPLRAQVVVGMRSLNMSPNGSVAFVRQLGAIAQKMRFSVDHSTADMALTQFLWNLANSDDEAATRYLEASDSEIQLTLKAASSDEMRQSYLDARQPEKDPE